MTSPFSTPVDGAAQRDPYTDSINAMCDALKAKHPEMAHSIDRTRLAALGYGVTQPALYVVENHPSRPGEDLQRESLIVREVRR